VSLINKITLWYAFTLTCLTEVLDYDMTPSMGELATTGVAHHLNINDHLVRIPDISRKLLSIYFLMYILCHVTESTQQHT
jgi:hypothetical protein